MPEGFETDLASVPWFARWYVSRDGNHTRAAVIHDYLYARASEASFPGISRRTADRVFLEALRACNLRPTLARVLYSAVRIGGGSSFPGVKNWQRRIRQKMKGGGTIAPQKPPSMGLSEKLFVPRRTRITERPTLP